MMDMKGNSLFEITVDHDLWRLAQKFDELYKHVDQIKIQVQSIQSFMKENEGSIYEGRGRDEFDLFIKAYLNNIEKLAALYMYCNAYVSDTLTVMMEFDETLKKKFELGVMDYVKKYPEEAKKLLGEQ